jgi:hypothetical protein
MHFKLLLFLLLGLASSLASGSEPTKTAVLLLENKIAAANSHYKSVLTQLFDTEMSVQITRDKVDVERFEKAIGALRPERERAQADIENLVRDYNSLQRKARAPRENQKNSDLILAECQIAAASSHHKTVLTVIADRQTATDTGTNSEGATQANSDLTILKKDAETTERVIIELSNRYDSLVKRLAPHLSQGGR